MYRYKLHRLFYLLLLSFFALFLRVNALGQSFDHDTFVVQAMEAISSMKSLSVKYSVTMPSQPDWVETYNYQRDGSMVRLELIKGTGISDNRYVTTDGDNYYSVLTIDGRTSADVFNTIAGTTKLSRRMMPDYALGIQVFDADGASLLDALVDPS